MPQPVPCAKATTPSTFGYSARRSGVKYSAILCATVAEQFTVDSTPMKLRVATWPFSRTMPMNVARSASGIISTGL
jgi:hypothetical protein